jgi:hypothetical protein
MSLWKVMSDKKFKEMRSCLMCKKRFPVDKTITYEHYEQGFYCLVCRKKYFNKKKEELEQTKKTEESKEDISLEEEKSKKSSKDISKPTVKKVVKKKISKK